MAGDYNEQTLEEKLARFSSIKKMSYGFAISFALFGFAMVTRVLNLGFPAMFGWIFIGGAIAYFLGLQFLLFPKVERAIYDKFE